MRDDTKNGCVADYSYPSCPDISAFNWDNTHNWSDRDNQENRDNWDNRDNQDKRDN